MSKNKKIWIMIYSAALMAFTVYLLLDTFVIARVYSAAEASDINSENAYSMSEPEQNEDLLVGTGVPSGIASGESGSAAESDSPVITDTSYEDSHITVSLSEYREYDTTIYVADVQIDSPEYLQAALAKGLFGKNITEATSDMAENAGAILAINGDYYGSQEKGYVIRNGILYRNVSAGREDLMIYSDGSLGIIDESGISAEQLLADGAWQVLSFGPSLIENGEISVTEDDEVGKAMASNPRTAIAVIDELHYLFIVSDGRTDESEGLSLYQLAEFIQTLGASTAYNLDGGGSSTMYFNGEVINNPTTNGRKVSERNVSDILYIGY